MKKHIIFIRIILILAFAILVNRYITELLRFELFVYDFQTHLFVSSLIKDTTIDSVGASSFGIILYIITFIIVMITTFTALYLFLYLVYRKNVEKNRNKQPSLFFEFGAFFVSFSIYMLISLNLNSEISLNQYKILKNSFEKNQYIKDYYKNNFNNSLVITKRDYFNLIQTDKKHKLDLKEKQIKEEKEHALSDIDKMCKEQ